MPVRHTFEILKPFSFWLSDSVVIKESIFSDVPVSSIIIDFSVTATKIAPNLSHCSIKNF